MLFSRQSIYNPELDVVAYYYSFEPPADINYSNLVVALASGLPVIETSEMATLLNGFDKKIPAAPYLPGNDSMTPGIHVLIDLKQLKPEEALQACRSLIAKNTNTIVLNIPDWESFQQFKQAGANYFHGKFISQANLKHKKNSATNNLVVMELLSQLQNPDVEIDTIEELISRDIALSYKLLKYINSAAFALQREVDSIRHAIVMLGLNTIVSLANLMLMSNIENKPKDLFMIAMIRARMCENLSRLHDEKKKDIYFTTGLFSVVDALTDSPMDEAIEQLPLISDIKAALIKGEGKLGETLGCCIALQQGSTDHLACPNASQDEIQQAYTDALEWCNQVSYLVEPAEVS